MSRPSWGETWLQHAEVISHRSLCDSRKIGAVIVSADNSYSVVGYNGPPRGLVILQDDKTGGSASCTSWCPRRLSDERSASYIDCVSIHAEANALIRADFTRIQGGAIFVTSAVCWDCGKLVANSGIKYVYMNLNPIADAHRDPKRTIALMRQCGLEVYVV